MVLLLPGFCCQTLQHVLFYIIIHTTSFNPPRANLPPIFSSIYTLQTHHYFFVKETETNTKQEQEQQQTERRKQRKIRGKFIEFESREKGKWSCEEWEFQRKWTKEQTEISNWSYRRDSDSIRQTTNWCSTISAGNAPDSRLLYQL